MYDRKPLWAWVIAGLGRFAPGGNGTVLPFLALKQGRDAAHACSLYSQLLRTTAEGEVVLVMAESKNLSILLADDHTLIGDALAHVFKTAKYDVDRVFDGVTACERIAADVERFDTLIADHHQPRISGPELADWLRRAGFTGRIIVYSAKLSEEEMKQYRKSEAEMVLVEASESKRLLEIVKTLHGQK
jgi:CheY-like chemotaxis protein